MCRSRTCPAPGLPTSTSWYLRTSGPPISSNRTALATASSSKWVSGSGGGLDDAQLLRLRIRRESVRRQRLVGAAVEGADPVDAPRVLGGRDLAPELARHPHQLLNLLDAAHL